MAILKKSTAWNRAFLMVQSSDHLSALTGATVTCNISKNGAAFGAAGGSVTEIANGWYYVALNPTDTGTAGDLAYHCTATSGDATDFADQVCDPAVASLGVNAIQLAGQTITAAAGVTFPTSVASPTNITAGVITTVTTVTNQLTAAAIATGVWQDATAGDFTTASSVGKSLYNAFTAGTSVFTTASLANAPSGTGASAATI